MNIGDARSSVGRMVMSRDPGHKTIYCASVPHGPYELLQITKSGEAILKGREEHRVPPSLISLCDDGDL